MSLELRQLYEWASGAAAVNQAPFRTSGEKVSIHVLAAPGNLVRVMGSNDGTTFDYCSYEGGGGVALLNGVGAGIYEVRERPAWMLVGTEIDGAAPRNFRALVLIHMSP